MIENNSGYLSHEFLNSIRENLEVYPVVPIVPFKYDKTKDSWNLLVEGETSFSKINQFKQFVLPNGKELELIGENRLNGEEMMRRAKEFNASGQHQAEYLLEHQELIPAEEQDHDLIFPETVWWDSNNSTMMIPCLWDQHGQRHMGFRWIGSIWYPDVRFVVPKLLVSA